MISGGGWVTRAGDGDRLTETSWARRKRVTAVLEK